LNLEERMCHNEEGLCFNCPKMGHRHFQCPGRKGKEAIRAPSKKP
jgi:hypothetical protein